MKIKDMGDWWELHPEDSFERGFLFDQYGRYKGWDLAVPKKEAHTK